MFSTTAAIILAAGRGTRMKSSSVNKVMSDIGGRPLLSYTVDNIRQAGIDTVVIVVGFARESIQDYFKDSVQYALQHEPLGTADAAMVADKILPKEITTILSVYGDDSYLYSPKLIQKLLEQHDREDADITLLTVDTDNPEGLGRIIRDGSRGVCGIVEDKVATKSQKEIKEINTGCYVFKRSFLVSYLPKITKNPTVAEYFLTDIIELAVRNGKKLSDVRGGKIAWRGVNNPEELHAAREIMRHYGQN